MSDETALTQAYRLQQQQIEEQEEALLSQRDKGIDALDELADRACFYFKGVVDADLFSEGLRNLEEMRDEIIEAARYDRNKLDQEREQLELDYRARLRKLN